jgi:hypothetical protein
MPFSGRSTDVKITEQNRLEVLPAGRVIGRLNRRSGQWTLRYPAVARTSADTRLRLAIAYGCGGPAVPAAPAASIRKSVENYIVNTANLTSDFSYGPISSDTSAVEESELRFHLSPEGHRQACGRPATGWGECDC